LKKFIAILLVLTIIFAFAGCMGNSIPDNFTQIDTIQGVAFALPNDIAEKPADNDAWNLYTESIANNDTAKLKKLDKSEYIYSDNRHYSYIVPEKLIIVASTKLDYVSNVVPQKLLLENITESEQLEQYLTENTGLEKVEIKSFSTVNLSTKKVSATLNAEIQTFGKVSGTITMLQNEARDVALILYLYTDDYSKAVGEELATDDCKNVNKSLSFTGEEITKSLDLQGEFKEQIELRDPEEERAEGFEDMIGKFKDKEKENKDK
jgi:hypothetical protein